MRLIINENERNRILNLHRPSLLFEAPNYTISDLQSLIGVSVDNNFGPNTVLALKSILKGIPGNGCSSGAGSTTTTNTNYQVPPVKNPLEFS